ncbi:MAG TPA: trigger factor [Candidatus Acidoferrum sp.]|jgi:trigger factor|nr:trigger factor [Candidatus Acidoferrum sp.]
MKVAVEEIESCKRKLAVEAPVDVVTQEWERAYGRVQKRASLPGFRRGHVPRSLVKLHFADDVRREVAEHLIPDVYRRALTEARIDPVNEPDLQDLTLEEGSPLSFTAVVEVKPAIELGDYRGVEVQHVPAPVTDAEVDETLERMREQHAQFNSVERPAGAGDLVVVDYTLAPQDHEPTTANGYHFLVGSGTVLPEIDTAVVGMSAGEQREVSLQFAEDHRMESLRGKSGTASLKLGEVKEKVLPVLDDEFAKVLGEFETLDAVKSEVRRQLEAGREAESRRALEDKVMDTLLAHHEFGVPDAMVMRQVAHQVEHTRERLRRQGVDPDGIQWDYTKIVGELRPVAEKAVRRALLLEAIADKEALATNEEDVDAEVERFAKASQRPAPAVRRMMEKSGDLDALRHGLRERKTLDLLIEHTRVTT